MNIGYNVEKLPSNLKGVKEKKRLNNPSNVRKRCIVLFDWMPLLLRVLYY